MPKSKGRDKPTSPQPRPSNKAAVPNPVWFVPVMLGLMIIGLLWVVVFYITNEQWPLAALGKWNLGVGFALMLAGFAMTTNWR